MLKNLENMLKVNADALANAYFGDEVHPVGADFIVGSKTFDIIEGYNYDAFVMPDYRKTVKKTVYNIVFDYAKKRALSILEEYTSEVANGTELLPQWETALNDAISDIDSRRFSDGLILIALSLRERNMLYNLASYAGGFMWDEFESTYGKKTYFSCSDIVAKEIQKIVNSKIGALEKNREARIAATDVTEFRARLLRGLNALNPSTEETPSVIFTANIFGVKNAFARQYFGTLVYPRLTKKTVSEKDSNVKKNTAEFRRCALNTARNAIVDAFYISVSYSRDLENTDSLAETVRNQTEAAEKAEAERKATEQEKTEQAELAGNIVA